MPSTRIVGRRRRILFRLIVGGIVGVILSLLIVMTATQYLPEDERLGFYLYWVHDNVYLRVKGYTYVLFYPQSLFWGLILTSAFSVWLAFWLLDRSLVRGSHILLLRRAVHLYRLYPILLASARRLGRWRMVPKMLCAVAEHEWTKCVNRLTSPPSFEPSRGQLAALRHLTELRFRLAMLPSLPPVTSDHLRAFLILHRAYLLLHYHNEFNHNASRLLQSVYPARSCLAEGLATQNRFAPEALMAEVCLLLMTADQSMEAAGRVKVECFDDDGADLDPAATDPWGFLAGSIGYRATQLERWHHRLEQSFFGTQHRSNSPRVVLEEWTDIDRTDPSVVGQLAMEIALHTAWLTRAATIGLRFIDAVEALKLATDLSTSDLAERTNALLCSVPNSFDYALCAQLLERARVPREKEWGETSFAGSDDRPIHPGDINLGATRVEALYHAAGQEHQARQIQSDSTSR